MMSITLIWIHYALFRGSDMSISKINNRCWGGQNFRNQAIPLIITIISLLAPTQLSYAPTFLFFSFFFFAIYDENIRRERSEQRAIKNCFLSFDGWEMRTHTTVKMNATNQLIHHAMLKQNI